MRKISITYDNNVTQIFEVIRRSFYDNTISPLNDREYEIECMNTKQFKKHKHKFIEIKNKLKSFGNWCTDDSPIFNSIETQLLSLGDNQGGDHQVKSKFI